MRADATDKHKLITKFVRIAKTKGIEPDEYLIQILERWWASIDNMQSFIWLSDYYAKRISEIYQYDLELVREIIREMYA